MSTSISNRMGFFSFTLLGINTIIGSGIFLLPGKVMALSGSWSLFVYLAVTLMALAIAWCFAQCASLFSRNGGAYVYAKEAFGDFIGFEMGMMRWAVGIISWGSLVVGFITALSSIWPIVLEEPFRTVLILAVVFGLGWINVLGVEVVKRLSNLITIAKLLPLLFLILIGSFYMQEPNFTTFIPENFSSQTFGTAALVIFYAYGGLETLVVVAGEMQNPKKNAPLAVMSVIGFCSLLYLTIQVIAIGVLGPSLAHSVTPIADIAEKIFGLSGKWMIAIGMLISIGGINIAASFITPRSATALAEDGLIPRAIALTGKRGTPYLAIFLTCALSSLVALSGSFIQLVSISVVSRFTLYISTCLAAVVLRQHTWANRNLLGRIWCYSIPMIALGGVFWLMLQATWSQICFGFTGLLIGVPLYFMQSRKVAETNSPLVDIEG